MDKKYKIERSLILNEVKEGAAEDRVMVVDANNEVGSVARSEFGGGGGSQDLQSVVDSGNEVIDSEILFIGTNISGKNIEGTKGLVFDVQDGGIIFNNFSNETLTGQVSMRADNAVNGAYSLQFPDKTPGFYTLATTDDIAAVGSQDLQSVLDNGGVYISDYDAGERRILAFRDADNNKSHFFYIDSNSESGQKGGSMFIAEELVNFSGFGDNGCFGDCAINSGYINLTQKFDSFGTSVTRLAFAENLNEITTLFLPAKPTGAYTLATTDDIPTGLTQNITIGANTFTFTNGILTDFETVEGPTGDEV
ncbi:hypothetical protein [Flavobacterium polysaccharolyticum]|uniref:Uncharacterized protein n=1 Tax=Flavobacterium polysaccharolyticum TaxID=3133148 RepID=A0ABU9NIU6_9FLAO